MHHMINRNAPTDVALEWIYFFIKYRTREIWVYLLQQKIA